MTTVYRLKASELNLDMLEAIKTQFGDKEIEITVSEWDETAYLLQSEANRSKLLQAVENVKNNQNLIVMDFGALDE